MSWLKVGKIHGISAGCVDRCSSCSVDQHQCELPKDMELST